MCLCVGVVFCVLLYGLLLLFIDAFMCFFVVCVVVLVVRVRCVSNVLCDAARAVFVSVVSECLCAVACVHVYVFVWSVCGLLYLVCVPFG